VPTLRKIALTAPHFRSGKSCDLRQAVAVMTNRGGLADPAAPRSPPHRHRRL